MISLSTILPGLFLGFIGSAHCVGMCGPLALSLPLHHLSGVGKSAAIFLYNMGRIFTYSLLGGFLGGIGQRFYVAGFQQQFSLAVGIFVVVIAIGYYLFEKKWEPKWLKQFHYQVQNWMSYFLRAGKAYHFFPLGMANGLLPCGMVYMAIAGALQIGSVTNSMTFMAAFGFGTMPAMLLLSFFGVKLNLVFRQQIKKWMPAVVVIMGILLILRGLNLGIPFISPTLASSPGEAIHCH